MAKLVLLTTLLTINSNDLSTWCNKAELPVEVEEKDVTTFASDGWKEHLGGLKVGQLGLEGARAKAEALVARACKRLDLFGAKAELLRKAAVFVLERRS